MPRLVRTLPQYRKHRASGQAVVTLNGRDHYLGPHGTKASRVEYDRLVIEYLSSGRSPSFGAAQHDLTVVELAAEYLQHAKAYYGTAKTSEYHRLLPVIRLLRELYGRFAAVEFGPLQFKAIRQRCIDSDWSRSYVNANMRRLVRMFRWAAAEGKITATIPQGLAMIPGLRRGRSEARETAPILPVDAIVVEATLPLLPAVVADMVRLQRLTGARPAEICILRPRDVDRSGDVWHYRPTSHKTQHHGRDRVILLGPKSQDVLLRYLARDAEAFCFRPCDSEAKRLAERHADRKTPLCCGNRPGTNRKRKPRKAPGDCYTTDSYRRSIAYACDKAFPHPTLGSVPRRKLPAAQLAELSKWQSDHRWAPNQLRHAAATEVRREFGLEAAQILLGHSAADITQIYAERDMTKGVEVALAIG
jgi:integrase